MSQAAAGNNKRSAEEDPPGKDGPKKSKAAEDEGPLKPRVVVQETHPDYINHLFLELCTDGKSPNVRIGQEELLQKADLNFQDKDGKFGLQLAVANDHKQLAKLLLKNPVVDPNLTDNEGRTVFMAAVTRSDVFEFPKDGVRDEEDMPYDTFHKLNYPYLCRGLKIADRPIKRRTHMSMVLLILKCDRINNYNNKLSGHHTIHMAIQVASDWKLNTEYACHFVKTLQNHPKIELNGLDPTNCVRDALYFDLGDVMKLFLNQNQRPGGSKKHTISCNTITTAHLTLLSHCLLEGEVDCLRIFMTLPALDLNKVGVTGDTAQDRMTVLMMMVLSARHALDVEKTIIMFDTMLSNPRIDVNKKIFNNQTVLHKACSTKEPRFVARLLQQPELDVSCKENDGGWTATHKAVMLGNFKNAELMLMDHRTSLEQSDTEEGLLMRAVEFNFPDMLRLLIKSGCDVNVSGKLNGNLVGAATFNICCCKIEGTLKSVTRRVDITGILHRAGVKTGFAPRDGSLKPLYQDVAEVMEAEQTTPPQLVYLARNAIMKRARASVRSKLVSKVQDPSLLSKHSTIVETLSKELPRDCWHYLNYDEQPQTAKELSQVLNRLIPQHLLALKDARPSWNN